MYFYNELTFLLLIKLKFVNSGKIVIFALCNLDKIITIISNVNREIVHLKILSIGSDNTLLHFICLIYKFI